MVSSLILNVTIHVILVSQVIQLSVHHVSKTLARSSYRKVHALKSVQRAGIIMLSLTNVNYVIQLALHVKAQAKNAQVVELVITFS